MYGQGLSMDSRDIRKTRGLGLRTNGEGKGDGVELATQLIIAHERRDQS